MTLADLLTTLETRGALPPSRVKDYRTSIKYLAAALGHPSPEQCSVDAACRDPATWTTALETHFTLLERQGRAISAGTRRNTRNNLRVLLRQAEAQGLLTVPLPSRLLKRPNREDFRREQRATNPYPTTHSNQVSRRYWVLQPEWPPDIQAGWREYQAQCGLRIREESFRSYEKLMNGYVGYLRNICGQTPTWDDVFDTAVVTGFVRWHAARVGRTSSVHGRQTAILCATIAKVLEHPHARALADLRNDLKPPAPLHNKWNHWVSLATLEEVADAYLAEGRAPLVPAGKASRFPLAQRTGRFQRGLILKFLVRVPLRQRNIREMQLGKHLSKDPTTGHWHLEFSGDELKVGNRGSQVNTYHVDLTEYCPDLLPLLDEWFTVHRPRLPNAAASRFIFLTRRGKPHITKTLHSEIAEAVGMRTGQRFYPHLIRTIWATEYLEKTQDFTTAATLLGDTLGTVMKTYYHIVNKNQFVKAKAFLGTALHAG